MPVTAGEETLQTAAESLPTNPVAEEKPAPQHTEVAAHASEKEEAKPQPVEEKVEEAPLPVKETQAEAPQAPAETVQAAEEKPAPEEERKTDHAPAQKEEQEEKEPANKIFILRSETKSAPKVKVLGKIDLDALNQSTRPNKKSKEERKK